MQTLEILGALKARLAIKIPGLAVDFWPDKPDDYQVSHANGAILIKYPGSDYGKSDDVGVVIQERKINFQVVLLVRDLYGPDGAIAALGLVKASLLGWKAPHCGKMHLTRERALGERSGIHQYLLETWAKSVTIHIIDEDNTDA